MTTIETAGFGAGVLLLLGTPLAWTVARRDAWRLEAVWGFLVAVATVAFFAASPTPTPKRALVVALAVAFGVGDAVWSWRRLARAAPRQGLRFTRGVGELGLALLAAAPMLVVLTDPGASALEATDAAALLLFAAGAGVLAFGARLPSLRSPRYAGGALVAWGFYALALASPGGYLTLFAPLLLTRHVRRALAVLATLESGGDILRPFGDTCLAPRPKLRL